MTTKREQQIEKVIKGLPVSEVVATTTLQLLQFFIKHEVQLLWLFLLPHVLLHKHGPLFTLLFCICSLHNIPPHPPSSQTRPAFYITFLQQPPPPPPSPLTLFTNKASFLHYFSSSTPPPPPPLPLFTNKASFLHYFSSTNPRPVYPSFHLSVLWAFTPLFTCQYFGHLPLFSLVSTLGIYPSFHLSVLWALPLFSLVSTLGIYPSFHLSVLWAEVVSNPRCLSVIQTLHFSLVYSYITQCFRQLYSQLIFTLTKIVTNEGTITSS